MYIISYTFAGSVLRLDYSLCPFPLDAILIAIDVQYHFPSIPYFRLPNIKWTTANITTIIWLSNICTGMDYKANISKAIEMPCHRWVHS